MEPKIEQIREVYEPLEDRGHNENAVEGISRVGGPRLEISIDKSGGSVSASGATITSSRVVGILDGPSGGVTGSRTVYPRSFCAVNLVIGKQSRLGIRGNSYIPVGVGEARDPLHVRINFCDDFRVCHSVDVEIGLCFSNVEAMHGERRQPLGIACADLFCHTLSGCLWRTNGYPPDHLVVGFGFLSNMKSESFI